MAYPEKIKPRIRLKAEVTPVALPTALPTPETAPSAPLNAMAAAFAEPGRLNEKGRKRKPTKPWEETPRTENSEAKAVPPELTQIYGDKVPLKVLKMYTKLENTKKKESYLKLKAEEEKKKKAKKTEKAEEPFNLHSVRSIVTLEDQKNVQRTLKKGESSPKQILQQEGILVDKDINLRDERSLYTPRAEMQNEMDKLTVSKTVTAAGRPQEKQKESRPLQEPIDQTRRIQELRAEITKMEQARKEGTFYDDRFAGIAQDAVEYDLIKELRSLGGEETSAAPATVTPEVLKGPESSEIPTLTDVVTSRVIKEPGSIVPDPDQAIDSKHAWKMRRAGLPEKLEQKSFSVEVEKRDNDLEYVSIVPQSSEIPRREWLNTLKGLIDRLTK